LDGRRFVTATEIFDEIEKSVEALAQLISDIDQSQK